MNLGKMLLYKLGDWSTNRVLHQTPRKDDLNLLWGAGYDEQRWSYMQKYGHIFRTDYHSF
jgi:hypothetical protein